MKLRIADALGRVRFKEGQDTQGSIGTTIRAARQQGLGNNAIGRLATDLCAEPGRLRIFAAQRYIHARIRGRVAEQAGEGCRALGGANSLREPLDQGEGPKLGRRA
jgi:hypothetical protein